MKFSESFSGQRVTKQSLQFGQTSKNEAILERVFDVFEDGIAEGALNNFSIIGKDLDVLLQLDRVKVDTGIAYVAGERILLDDATIPYDATNPTGTTDDGKGNPILTPKSTGSFDIPITLGSINTIFIAYLLNTDELEFTLHKQTGEKQFFKRTDGFEIQVNTTGTNPDPARFLLVGTVDATGGTGTVVAANISILNRLFFRTRLLRIGGETANVGRTDRPSTYELGNVKISFNDHVKSVGTGPVSPFNPHGTSAADLGLDEANLVKSHRQNEHANGLVAGAPGNPAPQTTAMFVERVIVGLGDDFVRVKPLITGEFALVDGLAFDTTDFPSEVIINFITSTDPAGTYTIFFDSVTGTVEKTLLAIAADTTKLRLASIDWDNAGNLSPATERRQFGTVNIVQRWFTSSRPPAPLEGQFGYNFDFGTPEYFNGSIWIQL